MVRAIIIDDESDSIEILQNEISKHCKAVELVGSYESPKAGIKAINQLKPDVVFLDIEMPGINGFELLELIPDIDFDIIFTTAYDQFALRAFKVCALDYLLKPVDPIELRAAVAKVSDKSVQSKTKTQVQFLLQHLEELEHNNVKRIALPTIDGLEFIHLDDILFCESDGAYSMLHFKSGSKLLISKSLRFLEDILCNFHFSACINPIL